jgi:hypothetical protein
MNSWIGVVKKKQETIFKKSMAYMRYFKFFLRYDFGMRLFLLTIPKPLKQHPIKKKIIHSALPNLRTLI